METCRHIAIWSNNQDLLTYTISFKDIEVLQNPIFFFLGGGGGVFPLLALGILRKILFATSFN